MDKHIWMIISQSYLPQGPLATAMTPQRIPPVERHSHPAGTSEDRRQGLHLNQGRLDIGIIGKYLGKFTNY